MYWDANLGPLVPTGPVCGGAAGGQGCEGVGHRQGQGLVHVAVEGVGHPVRGGDHSDGGQLHSVGRTQVEIGWSPSLQQCIHTYIHKYIVFFYLVNL